MSTYQICELLGDGISAELAVSVRTLVDALPFDFEFVEIDLSDENRIRRGRAIYDEAVVAMKAAEATLKYPTATTADSPNKILREAMEFKVIHRPVCTIPGIETHFTEALDIDVVRIATGGTYEDVGRRIGADTAVSLRVIERGPALAAGRFAFKLAQMRNPGVVSTSKYTIQKATDGLFEETIEEVSSDYPATSYRHELFDSLLAGLIMRPDRYGVIVCPNEYGDFLSDMACGLIGSIGLGDSSSYSFDARGRVEHAMFDPSGGTAPDIAGQNKANPTATLLAVGSMCRHLGEVAAGEAIRATLLGAIADGVKTADLGGDCSTTQFTAEIASRVAGSLRLAA